MKLPLKLLTLLLCFLFLHLNELSAQTLPPEPCEPEFYVATCFTPDGDFLNDYFEVKFNCSELLVSFEMVIFDRRGRVIYEFKDVNDKWNGQLKDGNYFVQDGTYVWCIHAELMNRSGGQEEFTKTGLITIIR